MMLSTDATISPNRATAAVDGLSLLYVDAAILIVDKPAGLLTQPGRGPDKTDSVLTRLLPHYPDAVIVHRLDEPTSGLLVVARGREVCRTLNLAFRNRQVVKRYQAVVAGWLDADCGSVDLPLSADWPNRPRQKIDPVDGKPSLTRYRVLERLPEPARTRVDLEPVTGRSHQLRMHMMGIGHPIVGDPLYAEGEVRAQAQRLQLHACALVLTHPVTGAALAFGSPAPF